MEIWKDSSLLMLFLLVILLFITVITFLFILLHQKTLKKLLNVEIERSNAEILHKKDIIQTIVDVQEEERKRIARVIHDDIGNRINILAVWLNNPNAWNNERSKEIVMKLIPSLAEATRNISHTLYPVDIEHIGFIPALQELAVNASVALKINLLVNKQHVTFLALSAEVQVYRIVQEFLTNTLKHAEATEMTIQLRMTPKLFSVILDDNGKGFDTENIKKGMGLKNIESRMHSINAIFRWKSGPKSGCKLLIAIPNNEKIN